MANSVPVVATTVGSIPRFLEHRTNALLITPGSPDEFARCIIEIIENQDLRRTLIRNGYALAATNTLEIQARSLVEQMRFHLNPPSEVLVQDRM